MSSGILLMSNIISPSKQLLNLGSKLKPIIFAFCFKYFFNKMGTLRCPNSKSSINFSTNLMSDSQASKMMSVFTFECLVLKGFLHLIKVDKWLSKWYFLIKATSKFLLILLYLLLMLTGPNIYLILESD